MSLKDATTQKISTGQDWNLKDYATGIQEYWGRTQVGRTSATRQVLEL